MVQLANLILILAVYVGPGEGTRILNTIGSLINRGIEEVSPPVVQKFASVVNPPPGPVQGVTYAPDEQMGNDSDTNGFSDCVRTCDGIPMTCYFRLHIERYSVLGGACKDCAFGKPEDCVRPQCITANGMYRALITVNRQLPAPAIQVCKGDTIVADVENAMPDESVTIHWHGVRQIGFQYYDGVPYVTQCPIQPGTTFRYTFVVQQAGTFFYHSHTGIQKLDGVSGPLIVRDTSDSQSNLYTDDLPEHVLYIGDWTNIPGEQYMPGFNALSLVQVPDSLLINGRGMHWTGSFSLPLSEFRVTKGRKYRFRIIGGTCMTCAVAVRFQGHRVIAISADGNLKFKPTVVDTVIVNSAERFDVILEANQNVGVYYIYAHTIELYCKYIFQAAILRYEGAITLLNPIPLPPSPDLGVQLNPINSICSDSDPKEWCISKLQGVGDAPSIGDGYYAYLFIGLHFYIYNNDDLFKPGTYQRYDEPAITRRIKSLVNNISFTFPPSPMISQLDDIPRSSFCSPECHTPAIQKSCSCTNYYNLPYNAIVNMIIFDAGELDGFAHPFHLHGHNFYIIKLGRFPLSASLKEKKKILDELMDELNNDEVDLRNRPQRDTMSIPTRGYVLIRFVTDNPGYWLLHCHFVFHLESGMAAVLRVGDESLLPPVPENFPTCGNFLPPY